LPFVKKKEAVVVNQCPCIIAVWLYASFLNKGMAAFMRRTGSPKGSPHFPSAEKFIMRHAVPHDWETRLNTLHLWAGGGASIIFFRENASLLVELAGL